MVMDVIAEKRDTAAFEQEDLRGNTGWDWT